MVGRTLRSRYDVPTFLSTNQTRGYPMSVKQLFDLTGKVALITGGTKGLGLQMA